MRKKWFGPRSFAACLQVYAGIFMLAATISATAQESGPTRISYEGTLGTTRIGMTLIVQADNATITGGHYFYAKYLTDIPLTGRTQPGSVALKGEDGGSFDLRFKGNGSEGGKPLDFNNSVGMEGNWSKDGKSLPVTLQMQNVAAASARRYGSVTDLSDSAFEAKAQGFYKAVMTGDRAAAAKYVSYPLRVNLKGKTLMVHSAAELEAHWETIFPPQYLDRLKKDLPHDMGVAKGQAMIGPGDAWFDDKGATSLNVF